MSLPWMLVLQAVGGTVFGVRQDRLQPSAGHMLRATRECMIHLTYEDAVGGLCLYARSVEKITVSSARLTNNPRTIELSTRLARELMENCYKPCRKALSRPSQRFTFVYMRKRVRVNTQWMIIS